MNRLKLFFLILITSCSQGVESISPENLSAKTEYHYSKLKNRENVIGYFHYQTCDDISKNHLKYLRDSATKTELVWMLNDTCEKAFKVFLIEELHTDFPELDSMILSNYTNDSTEIRVVTSCLGIVDLFRFGDICNNIITNNTVTFPVNALPPPPPFFKECDSLGKLAKQDYKNGIRKQTTFGMVEATEFEQFHSQYMKSKFNIITRASCTIDFNDECYYNSMNNAIEKEYGENFINETREKAKIEFEKLKE